MKRFEWIVCCAIAAGLLAGPPGKAEAQVGGGREAKESSEQKQDASVDAASLMRGSDYDSGEAPEDTCRCTGEGAVGKIKQALNQPLVSAGFDFTDTPLEEVASQLSEDYNVPVHLDVPALDNAGLGPDERVNIKVRGVSLKSALRLMLKQLQMTYIIANETLILTTPEEAEADLQLCVYDVGDLIGDKGQALNTLMEAIISCVATNTWAENGGGEAEIRPLPPRFLVISQTQAVHDEIGDLLKTIRAMRGGTQATQPPTATLQEPEPKLATPFAE